MPARLIVTSPVASCSLLLGPIPLSMRTLAVIPAVSASSLRRRHGVDSSPEQQQELLRQENEQVESAPLPAMTPECLHQTGSGLRAPCSFTSLASRIYQGISLGKLQLGYSQRQADAMLSAAMQKSKDLAPDAPTAWQNLASFCRSRSIEFSVLVDGTPNAIESVLRSHDWESVAVLGKILPTQRYLSDRIARTDVGSLGFLMTDEIGPARIVHPRGLSLYTGDSKDGYPEGKGIMTGSNGISYSGEFKESMYHGRGLYEDKTTGEVYSGYFQKGKYLGTCPVHPQQAFRMKNQPPAVKKP
jgi:hypothetical protein